MPIQKSPDTVLIEQSVSSQHPVPHPRKSPTVPLPVTMALTTEGSLQFLGTEPAGTLHQEKPKRHPNCSPWSSRGGHGSSGFVPEVKHTSAVPSIKFRVAALMGVSCTSKYWTNSCRLAGRHWYRKVAHHHLGGGLQGTLSCVIPSRTLDGDLRQGCLTHRRMKTHVGARENASDPEGTSAP